MMKFILAAALTSLAFTACSKDAGITTPTSNEAASSVVISQARLRPPLPGQTIAAGYFTLQSESADKLLAVSSDVSERIELHNHINDGGVMRMRRLEGGVAIPAGGQIEFKPGGYHIMLFDAKMTDQTEDVALTFKFETAGDVTIIADVMTGASYGSGKAKDEDVKKSYGSGH